MARLRLQPAARQDCEQFIKKAVNWQLSASYIDIFQAFASPNALRSLEDAFAYLALHCLLPPALYDHVQRTKSRSALAAWTQHHLAAPFAVFSEVHRRVVSRPLARVQSPAARIQLWRTFTLAFGDVGMAEQDPRRSAELKVLMQLDAPSGWPLPAQSTVLDVLHHCRAVWRE
ncbi:hypothetical protein JCM10207_005210 [Rhodosporidiobolus poonsookiae]